MELQSLRARRFLHVSHQRLGYWIIRVDEQRHRLGLGYQLREQLKPLGCHLACHENHAREVAARPGETGDQAGRDRLGSDEDDRDSRCRVFRCACRRNSAAGRDHVDPAADEVGGQSGQPIVAFSAQRYSIATF